MMTCRRDVLTMDLGRIVLASLLVALVAGGCAAPAGDSGIIPAQPGAAGNVTCSGTVVDANGNPVAGASVTAWAIESAQRDIPGQARQIGRCVSGVDGAWKLAVPPARHGEMLGVVATRPGLAMGWARVSHRRPDEPLTVRMGKASTLAGTVIDEKGAPIAGAEVRLALRAGGREGGRDPLQLGGAKDLLTRVTDAKGRFAFDNVPSDARGLFSVRAAGFGRLDTAVSDNDHGIAPPRTDLKLVLPPAGRIEVQVVEKDTGKGVPEVAIQAENWRAILPVLAEPVNGSPGTYVFDDLPAGRYEISVATPADGLAAWTAAPVRVSVEAGQTTRDVKVELVRGGVAQIKLVSAADGKAVERGHVGIAGDGHGWFTFGVENGTSQLRLAAGEYTIRYASGDGYARARPDKDFIVEANKAVQVEIELAPIPQYEGVVVDPAGKPVGASLCILPEYRYTTVGEDGAFSIGKDTSRWPKRSSFLLIARLTEGDLAGWLGVGKPGRLGQIKLAPAVTINGRVTDPAGNGIRGADVHAQVGRWDAEDLPALARVRTDRQGRYAIKDLPAGLDYTVSVRANGRMPVAVYAGSGSASGGPVEAPHAVLPRIDRNAPAPAVRLVPLPEIPDSDAVWGSVARDDRGHIWIGVTMAERLDQPSAHLVEYDPATDKAVDRGDVLAQLKRAGVYRQGEGQLKIHSRVVQAGDGYLYFASMDEKGEDMGKEVLGKWGSHLWRTRPGAKDWEHLLTIRESVITLDAGKRYVYALGYYRHALVQYDTATGRSRSVEVGAIDGHISRNMFVDARDHVYVPRVAPDPAGGHPICSLVEYDTALKEVASTRLTHYFEGRALNAHGIIGFAKLPDGNIACVSHEGELTLVKPSADGPAKVVALGWLHPRGEAYTGSLECDPTGRYLYSCVQHGWTGDYDWVTYDLKTHSASVAPFRVTDPRGMSLDNSLLYGSNTRDAQGNYYIVGRVSRGRRMGYKPVVFQVKPARAAGR